MRDAWAMLGRIDDVFNVHRPDSELGAINRRGAGRYPLSTWLGACLEQARSIEELCGGAWSATLLPLAGLWRRCRDGDQAPDAGAIAAARAACSRGRWRLDDGVLEVDAPGVGFDLGGLAKGFAVDLVTAQLRRQGVRDLLVQVGGETACLGLAAPGRRHRLGIPHPDDPDRCWSAVLAAPDGGLCGSTSGDYRLGRHVIDPRTGMPADSQVVSATCVFAGTGCNALADGISTAAMILGPAVLLELRNATGCEGCCLRRDAGGALMAIATPGWQGLAADG